MNTLKLCQQKPLLCIIFLANTISTTINHIDNKSTYGLDVYKTMVQKLDNTNSNFLRGFHLLYEHKYLMNSRLTNILEEKDNLIKEYRAFYMNF